MGKTEMVQEVVADDIGEAIAEAERLTLETCTRRFKLKNGEYGAKVVIAESLSYVQGIGKETIKRLHSKEK